MGFFRNVVQVVTAPVRIVNEITREVARTVLPAPVASVVTSVSQVATTATTVVVDTTLAGVEVVVTSPARLVSGVVTAIEKPTLENIVNAVPSGPLGTVHGPKQVLEEIKVLIDAKTPGELIEKKLEVEVKKALGGPALDLISSGIRLHLRNMQEQAASEGRWKSLSEVIVAAYKNHYGVDLTKIRYAENINTRVKDTAMTFPGEMFFPRAIDPEHNREDLHWILHEITHLEQYVRLGGLESFLDKYVTDAVVTSIKEFTFNPHDFMPHEQEANGKADHLLSLNLLNIEQPRFGR